MCGVAGAVSGLRAISYLVEILLTRGSSPETVRPARVVCISAFMLTATSLLAWHGAD